MKLLKTILTHATFISAVMLLVPLIIDVFFNAAMGFVDNPLYKSIFMVMLVCAATSSALQIYTEKKK